MPTHVQCREGHRWMVDISSDNAVPQLSCPTCGGPPAYLADDGWTESSADNPSSNSIPLTAISSGTLIEHPLTVPALPPLPRPPVGHRADDGGANRAGAPPFQGGTPPKGPKNIADYEVLEVLGRGGMGVVYKAFQPSLKRVVAIKIMSDPASDLHAYTRFRTEAEAIAQLQHPNIAQIHEIGEHDGRPFLSLEFVDGGTLARRLARALPPPREAAQLVELLARAMHFAHERGIIHRDLKPSNVLLTKDGQPKISDFGLAKRTNSSSDGIGPLTQTGDVLGTPSYMAPEQAGGMVRQMGPATDVYALGVILYEMLTGSPPFDSSSALQSLHRVLHEEPTPPTKLQPRVPRDLETICLTCLEKTPAKRYASAAALADELRAFLAGDPIKARPANGLERLVRWARQRPMAAVLLAVAAVALAGVVVGAWMQHAVAGGAIAVLGMLLAAWWYNARLQTALRELAHEHLEGQHNVERLQFLLEATQQLMAARDVDSLLTILSETAARLVTAERATIFMLDPVKAELWSRIAMGDDVGEIRVPLGTGISGMVALTGETIILDDPYNDVRFNPDVDKRTGYRTRNLLTMPVRSPKGTILGVFQLLNKRQSGFGKDDVALLTTLAASAAVALENSRLGVRAE